MDNMLKTKRITSKNLDYIIQENLKISSKVEALKENFLINYNDLMIKSNDIIALELLKSKGLISVVIDNQHFGGAVYILSNNRKLFLINTALPRVNQHFVCWHEVYHLLYDEHLTEKIYLISSDLETNERMADYFASKMIFGNLYDYYIKLDKDLSFEQKILYSMYIYRAPYKAVLVELYENAYIHGNEELKTIIKDNIDIRIDNISEKFKDMGLDSSLVEPTYMSTVSILEQKIIEEKKKYCDKNYNDSNLKYYKEIMNEINKLTGEIKSKHM